MEGSLYAARVGDPVHKVRLQIVMLVLSRKVGERILIGDKVTVTVVRITGGGVRIGIEAPAEMPVIREELKDQLRGKDSKSAERPVR